MDNLPPDFVMHSEILIGGSILNMTDGAEGNFSDDNFFTVNNKGYVG